MAEPQQEPAPQEAPAAEEQEQQEQPEEQQQQPSEAGPAFEVEREYELHRRLLAALREREGSVPAQREAVVELLGLDDVAGPSREGARAELAVQAAMFAYEAGFNHTQARVYRSLVAALAAGVADGSIDSADAVFDAFGRAVRQYAPPAGAQPAGDTDREECERREAAREREAADEAAAAADEAAAAAEAAAAPAKGKKKKQTKEQAAAEEAERAAAEAAAAEAREAAAREEREAAARLAVPRVFGTAQIRAAGEEVAATLCAHFTLYRAVLRPGHYEPRSRVDVHAVLVENTVPFAETLQEAEDYEARIKAEAAAAEEAAPEAEEAAPEADEAAPEDGESGEPPAEGSRPATAKSAASSSSSSAAAAAAPDKLAALRSDMERRLEENRRELEARLARLEGGGK